jgi:hypothetical protein
MKSLKPIFEEFSITGRYSYVVLVLKAGQKTMYIVYNPITRGGVPIVSQFPPKKKKKSSQLLEIHL